jgi:chaperonin cofactor prefoldin
MTTIFIILSGIIIVIAVVISRFIRDLNKDSRDLQNQSLAQKFSIIASAINDVAYRGKGQIMPLDKRSFNLYEEGQNQIIQFYYSTGSLTITWKYKYFQQEVVHTRDFYNVRKINVSGQQKIAESMINEMQKIIAKHQNNVLGT